MFRNKWFVGRFILVLMAALVVCGGCALQRDVSVLDRRITALHRQVIGQQERLEALEGRIVTQIDRQAKTGDTLRNKQADLGSLLNQIRDELKALRGRLEESEYRAAKHAETWEQVQSELKNRLQHFGEDLSSSQDRLVRLEEYLGMEPSEKLDAKSQPDAGSPDDGRGTETADGLYVQAKEQFDKGKYETAQTLFQRFLEAHPRSKKADNAQFWIGEIYYREKWYEKAILEYQKVIETYPKGNKVRSALLKQGLAFLNLGDKDNARLILKELVRKHPDSSEAKIAAERLDRF